VVAGGISLQSPSIRALASARSGTLFRQASKTAPRSASLRSPSGRRRARMQAWSMGGAAGSGAVVSEKRAAPTRLGVPGQWSAILSFTPSGKSSGRSKRSTAAEGWWRRSGPRSAFHQVAWLPSTRLATGPMERRSFGLSAGGGGALSGSEKSAVGCTSASFSQASAPGRCTKASTSPSAQGPCRPGPFWKRSPCRSASTCSPVTPVIRGSVTTKISGPCIPRVSTSRSSSCVGWLSPPTLPSSTQSSAVQGTSVAATPSAQAFDSPSQPGRAALIAPSASARRRRTSAIVAASPGVRTAERASWVSLRKAKSP